MLSILNSRYRRQRLLAALGAMLAGVGLAAAALAQTPQPQSAAAAPQATMPDIPVPPPPDFESSSWVLMDYDTGSILASKEPDLRVEPASITKIMTDYVVSAAIDSGKVHLDDPVYISENAWRGGGAGTDGSTSFLKVNSRVPLKDLLYGLVIQSGNDSAIALAEHVAGSETTFAALMNTYAERLGMHNTHYMNASGYPAEGHYSTARDTAILSAALIRDYPEDYKISSIKEFTWNGIKQYNRNSLLWRDPSVDGIKTGHTKAAGYCLAASAIRDGHRLIAVVMGAPSTKARVDDVQALLNYGYRFYESHRLYAGGQELLTPRLWKGAKNHLPVGLAQDLTMTVKRGSYDKLKVSVHVPATLIAPYQKGQQVGTLTVTLDGDVLVSRPVVALADAPQGGFFARLWDTILLWFHSDAGNDTTVAPTSGG